MKRSTLAQEEFVVAQYLLSSLQFRTSTIVLFQNIHRNGGDILKIAFRMASLFQKEAIETAASQKTINDNLAISDDKFGRNMTLAM